MKRLYSKIMSEQPNTSTYYLMYEGAMNVIPFDNTDPFIAYDSSYYSDSAGFSVDESNRVELDKPTVTVMIPAERLTGKLKEGNELKRLKYFLLNMENDTSTYKEMYNGEKITEFSAKCEGTALPSEKSSDPSYWHDGIMLDISRTHKLAQDKPTLTWCIPAEKLGIQDCTVAAADYCLRAFKPYIDALNAELFNRSRPDSENGRYFLRSPGGEVTFRNTAFFAVCHQKDYVNGSGSTVYLLDDGISRPPRVCLCLRLQVQLPKKKLRKAAQMLCKDLPEAVDEYIADFDRAGLEAATELSAKQTAIREWLKKSDYCAFIADGSILPREKDTELPMKKAIPFVAPVNEAVTVCGLRGLGIKKGVTVITGGGYSGKSTLLDAIAGGIYDHIAGDGRELCITDDTAITVAAEDGRSVKAVNVEPFIKWIPGGNPKDFSTSKASGSTSQAANIMEAVDSGSRLLLIDEDRSATNFMIRDKLMKELIEKEPITPFTDRVNELAKRGVSTVLVIGGSGEYLSVADNVYMMDDFVISNVTASSTELCGKHSFVPSPAVPTDWTLDRYLLSDGFTSYPEGSGSEKLEIPDTGFVIIGDERLDLRPLHDLCCDEQRTALGFILRTLEVTLSPSDTASEAGFLRRLDELYGKIYREGLDTVYSGFFTGCGRFLDLPRKQEVIAAVNRMRKVTFIK